MYAYISIYMHVDVHLYIHVFFLPDSPRICHPITFTASRSAPYASPAFPGDEIMHMRVCLTVRAYVRHAEISGAGRERLRQRAQQQL